MRRILVLSLLVASAAFAGDTVIKRGAAISKDARAVTMADVIATPDDFTKDAVLVEGVVVKNCTNMGCWMEIAPAAGKTGMRVTFEDYGFFIPLQSKGMKARAEGVTEVKTLSKSEADHLEGEGATITRNPDGSAREVSFVASGVELSRK